MFVMEFRFDFMYRLNLYNLNAYRLRTIQITVVAVIEFVLKMYVSFDIFQEFFRKLKSNTYLSKLHNNLN